MLASLALLSLLAPQDTPTPLAPDDVSALGFFGTDADVSGDVVVVGAYNDDTQAADSGSAHFYERAPATGAWSRVYVVRGSAGDRTGFRVAVDDDLAVLGHLSSSNRPVRIVERSAQGWDVTATLDYPGVGTWETRYGWSVDVSGETVVVGASYAIDGGGGETGAVYVYERIGGSWTQVQRILPPANPSSGTIPTQTWFGQRVSIDGDLLAIGAPNANGGPPGVGRVYVYERVGGQFVHERTVLPPGLPGSFRFGGYGFALSGERLAVGAIGVRVNGIENAGLVHLYERGTGDWPEVERVVDPLPSIRAYFGDRLALDGDRLVVGRSAYFRRTQQQRRLSLEVFERAPQTGDWAHVHTLFDPLEAGDTNFGQACAVDGTTLVAGALGAVVDGAVRGTVYIGDVTAGWSQISTLACGGGPCSCPPWEPWAGCGNGTNEFSELTTFGTPSQSSDDLTFTAIQLPPLTIGRLMLGPATAPPRPFGDGTLCIQSPLELGPRVADGSGTLVVPEGVASRAASTHGAAGQILAGETWVFQVIYGEPRRLIPCQSHFPHQGFAGNQNGRPYLVQRGFNLTNALSVTFRP